MYLLCFATSRAHLLFVFLCNFYPIWQIFVLVLVYCCICNSFKFGYLITFLVSWDLFRTNVLFHDFSVLFLFSFQDWRQDYILIISWAREIVFESFRFPGNGGLPTAYNIYDPISNCIIQNQRVFDWYSNICELSGREASLNGGCLLLYVFSV